MVPHLWSTASETQLVLMFSDKTVHSILSLKLIYKGNTTIFGLSSPDENDFMGGNFSKIIALI